MYSRFASAGGADRRPPLPTSTRPSRDHFPGDPARIGQLENRTLEDEVRRELQIDRRARADRSALREVERLSVFSQNLDFRFGESSLPAAFIRRPRYPDASVGEELGSGPLPLHDHHGCSERFLSIYKPSFTSSYYEAVVGERSHLDPRFDETVQPHEIRPVGLPGCPPASSGPRLIPIEAIKPRPKRKFQFRDCDAITLTLDPSLKIPGAKRKEDETVVSTYTEAIMDAPTDVLRGPAGENSFSMVSTTSKQGSELHFQGKKCLDTSKASDQIPASTSLAEVSSHKAKEIDKLLPGDEAKELDQPPMLKEVPDVKIAPGEQQKMLFYCHLCRVNCWGLDGLESHLNGRYHQARLRERGFKKHRKGKKHNIKEERVTVEISLLSDSVSSALLAMEADQPRNAKDVHCKKTTPGKKQFLLFSCHICSVNCLGQAGLDNHLKGRKHQEALRQPKDDKQA